MFKLQQMIRFSNFKTIVPINNYIKVSYNVNVFPRTFCSANKEELAVDFDAITGGDKELEHKLKVIMLEAEVLRQEGRLVPPDSFMTTEFWKNALSLGSRSARSKYFQFLFKKMKMKENEKEKKLKKKMEFEESRKTEVEKPCESIEEFAQRYGLKYNSILLRIRDTTINNFYNNRLIQAIQYGQKLVIDCGYDEHMTKRENLLCAKQLMLLFAENRQHDDPFDLYYSNINKQSDLYKNLYKFIPTLEDPAFPLNVHERSYLDLFPKEQLVYLTPHCREEMEKFDHDAVYIIGGIVDKINNEPLSLAKAKREGIKMCKFPLDRYLQWGAGSGKSLTLNQVTAILLDLKTTGNWEHALRHVPKRKVVDTTIHTDQYKFQNRDRVLNKKWVPLNQVDLNNLKYNPGKETNKNKRINVNFKDVISNK